MLMLIDLFLCVCIYINIQGYIVYSISTFALPTLFLPEVVCILHEFYPLFHNRLKFFFYYKV